MAWTTGASEIMECHEDQCEPDSGWKDFKEFVWFQTQLIFWSTSFYVFVQLMYSFTGKLV